MSRDPAPPSDAACVWVHGDVASVEKGEGTDAWAGVGVMPGLQVLSGCHWFF